MNVYVCLSFHVTLEFIAFSLKCPKEMERLEILALGKTFEKNDLPVTRELHGNTQSRGYMLCFLPYVYDGDRNFES